MGNKREKKYSSLIKHKISKGIDRLKMMLKFQKNIKIVYYC